MVVPGGGDGKPGCNLTGSTTLGLSVTSSNTAVATVSPSSVTFTSCDDVKTLTVTPVASGTATISVAQASNNTGGSFDLAPAAFTASYDKGSVPAATCQVTDAEDGNSSFAATLSEVSGPNAADGIGLQTASCSYTDAGGLTAGGSKTYGTDSVGFRRPQRLVHERRDAGLGRARAAVAQLAREDRLRGPEHHGR